MKNHANRIKKLEALLNPDETDYQVIILTSFIDDFIKAGYFKDEAEQSAFTDWRLEKARAEAKLTGRPLPIIFMLKEDDIKTHLENFRGSYTSDSPL